MAMNFEELTPPVRTAMLEAFEEELRSEQGPFESAIMTADGRLAYPDLLRVALREGTEVSLAETLARPDFWTAKDARGADVPFGARATQLALTEFNIWYVAGLAAVLQREGETECMVYRADKPIGEKGECSVHEERTYSLEDVVAGHRIHYRPRSGQAVRGAFCVPAGPSCHHTIKRLPS